MSTQLSRQIHEYLETSSELNSSPHKQMDQVNLDTILRKLPVSRGFKRNILPSPGNEKWTLGIPEIDQCLPLSGLAKSGLHEIESHCASDVSALTGFAFSLLARLRSYKPILWCVTSQQIGDHGHLYAHGMQRFGVHPSQIIMARVNRHQDLHFILEEALKTTNIAAVVSEGPIPDFTGSRRLATLSSASNTPCILLNGKSGETKGSAALTRWQVKSTRSIEDPRDPFGPGFPTWEVNLTRVRGGVLQPQADRRIAWDEQTLSFRTASILANRTVLQNGNRAGMSHHAMVG